MENEINKLKREYLETAPPQSLINTGLNDLWERVERKRSQNLRNAYIFAGFLLIIVILTGSVGVISANAKPGDTFYPVKAITKNFVEGFTPTRLEKIYNPKANNKDEVKAKPSPATSPLPTISNSTGGSGNKNSKDSGNGQNTGNGVSNQPKQNPNSGNGNVKGVASENNAGNQNSKSVENSHGNNENSQKPDSQNQPNNENKKNNSNGKNSD